MTLDLDRILKVSSGKGLSEKSRARCQPQGVSICTLPHTFQRAVLAIHPCHTRAMREDGMQHRERTLALDTPDVHLG